MHVTIPILGQKINFQSQFLQTEAPAHYCPGGSEWMRIKPAMYGPEKEAVVRVGFVKVDRAEWQWKEFKKHFNLMVND